MSEAELQILLMGYVDGELDDADQKRVEDALASDDDLRAEFESMKRLKELTAGIGIDEKTDAQLTVFWGSVYNRTERRIGWLLLLAGVLGLSAVACFLFLDSESTHWSVKALVACMGIGALILLWSVWRERQLIAAHDRYSKEVHR